MAWALAREISVLPRSTNAKHLAENMQLLDPATALALSEEQLRQIDELDGTVSTKLTMF